MRKPDDKQIQNLPTTIAGLAVGIRDEGMVDRLVRGVLYILSHESKYLTHQEYNLLMLPVWARLIHEKFRHDVSIHRIIDYMISDLDNERMAGELRKATAAMGGTSDTESDLLEKVSFKIMQHFPKDI